MGSSWPRRRHLPRRPRAAPRSFPAQTSGAANSAMTATTKRSDGTTQITYGGHPLYTYVGDKKAGDTTGQGQDLNGGKWYLVGTDGKALTGSTSVSDSTGSGWS